MNIREYLIRTAYENEDARGFLLPLVSLRTASEEALVSRVIKLAYENPEIRDFVLPFFTGDVLKEAKVKAKNRGNKKEKRKQNKAQKDQKRKGKKRSKLEKALNMPIKGQAEFERSVRNQRVEISEAMGGSLAVSTAIGYALDESSKLHAQAKEALAKLVEKWNASQAKKSLIEGAKKTSAALEASADFIGGVGNVVEHLGTVAREEGSEMLKGGIQDIGDAHKLVDEAGERFDRENKGTLDTLKQEYEDAYQAAWGEGSDNKAKAEAAADAKARAISGASKLCANLGVLAGQSSEDAVYGFIKGAEKRADLGANAKAGKGILKSLAGATMTAVGGLAQAGGWLTGKAVGRRASEIEDLKDQALKALSYVDPEELGYIDSFVDEDGVFDADAFRAEMDKKDEAFRNMIAEEMLKAVKGGKGKGKGKKKEVKVIDRTLSDEAFVAKTAVVKLAYENPEYRPQLLQLLQVPRVTTHSLTSESAFLNKLRKKVCREKRCRRI